ncbi:MAG: 16S rRNA (uracil(1498)-N(3))-methyltransferase [Nitrospiraceae bacterium]|nr:16S rRNA (uracil(1498)-N(3))-methyltransferase [Nitrospiraceae bacterium]
MRLFYPGLSANSEISLTGEDFNYLKNVLRAREGAEVMLFDGKGNSATAIITGISSERITARTGDVFPSKKTESGLKTVLLQGMLKGQKMDVVVQKATELGVSEIIPLITRRAEVRETRKTGRWRKIAREAARQCGRAVVPLIAEPAPLADFLKHYRGAGIIFWEEGGSGLKDASGKLRGGNAVAGGIAVAVGPEGGFAEEEVQAARGAGFSVCSLGPRILRAETAAIAALALIQYELGDIS